MAVAQSGSSSSGDVRDRDYGATTTSTAPAGASAQTPRRVSFHPDVLRREATRENECRTVDSMNNANDHQFTWRGVAVGLLIGTLMCFTNTYFGLQTGFISLMSMPASLLGFAIFKIFSSSLDWPFTPKENVLVQTVAVAVGSMPLSIGLVGVIPAMEKLLKKKEGGPLHISLGNLIIWSFGVAFFGVIFAVPLRKQIIVKEKLRFPSGTATALMIKILHGEKGTTAAANGEDNVPQVLPGERDVEERPATNDKAEWRRQTRLLLYSFTVSAIYTLITFFLPILRNLPVFGKVAAEKWEWTLNPSPAYVGQGIIMGGETTFAMLLGAILGWGALSPLAKHKGWAPGDVNDWINGSRGWIVWISLAAMLSDSIMSLLLITLEPFAIQMWRRLKYYTPLRSDGSFSISTYSEESEDDDEEDAPPEQLISFKTVVMGLVFSSALCIFCIRIVFEDVPVYGTIIALIAAMFLSVMGVRALGLTDISAVSGISKLTQLLFALVIPRSNPHSILTNLVAGAVSEAGAQQAGDIMQDLKAGYLLQASPAAQFYGQLIGAAFGAVISPLIYRLYDSVYEIPGKLFEIPTAYIWIDCARLVYGAGLPPHSRDFSAGFAALFALTTIAKHVYRGVGFAGWIPGGVAVGVGIYNTPSFTLARMIGGAVELWWRKSGRAKGPRGESTLIVVASGLVLGEGLVSIVNLCLASLTRK